MDIFKLKNSSKKTPIKISKLPGFFLKQIKSLNGDPHHIAIGMAVGVFVAITPTIPFHTVLALFITTLLKGSRPAAIIGVWFSNPLTIPPLYIGSYKIGILLLNKDSTLDITSIGPLSEMLKIGIDITTAMILGGMILGIIPSILTYFITKWMLVFIKKAHTTI